MGAPSISIAFIEKAQETIKRGERGIVAMIIKDSVDTVFTVITALDIPTTLTADNQQMIRNALIATTRSRRKSLSAPSRQTITRLH